MINTSGGSAPLSKIFLLLDGNALPVPFESAKLVAVPTIQHFSYYSLRSNILITTVSQKCQLLLTLYEFLTPSLFFH